MAKHLKRRTSQEKKHLKVKNKQISRRNTKGMDNCCLKKYVPWAELILCSYKEDGGGCGHEGMVEGIFSQLDSTSLS